MFMPGCKDVSLLRQQRWTGQKIGLGWNQMPCVRKRREGRHEMFSCRGCQLLLVAPQLFISHQLPRLPVVLFLLAAGLVVKVILVGLVQLADELLDVFIILIEPVLLFPLHETSVDSLLGGQDRDSRRLSCSASLLGISFRRGLSLAVFFFQASCMFILLRTRL